MNLKEINMDQFELFILLEKAKTVPMEPAEIQELTQTTEIKSTMNLMGLSTEPIDINETVKEIIQDIKKHYE
jgi:hypothetical protein